MKLSQNIVSLISLCCLLLLTGYVNAQALNMTAIEQSQMTNFNAPSAMVLASAEPTKAQFKVLAESGVKHIINLRPAIEQDWNEGEYVKSLGMQYHNIPINGVEGITFVNAEKLSQLLLVLKGDPVLVHCSSGNRVGALKALSASKSGGLSVDSAINEGKQWGLNRLEPTVREILEQQ